MSGYAHSERPFDDDEAELPRASVLFIVLAAVLCGAGSFLLFYWIITLAWVGLSGILLMGVGFLLLFSPRAGLDRAA